MEGLKQNVCACVGGSGGGTYENIPTSCSARRQNLHPRTTEHLTHGVVIPPITGDSLQSAWEWITSGSARQNSKHPTALIIQPGLHSYADKALQFGGPLEIKPSRRSLIAFSLMLGGRYEAHVFDLHSLDAFSSLPCTGTSVGGRGGNELR